MSKTNWAFDTNVLVYFLNQDSPHHPLARSAFATAEQQNHQITVAHQNIIELIQSLTSFYHLPLPQAVKQAQSLLSHNLKIMDPLPQTLHLYLDLCHSTTKSRNHFDLYLAATLLSHQVNTLITHDQSGFKNIPDLTIIPLKNFSLS